MKLLKIIFILSFALTLSACGHYWHGFMSFAPNHSKDYQKSKNGANLTVPPPMTQKKISDYYTVPNTKGTTTVSVAPPDSGSPQHSPKSK